MSSLGTIPQLDRSDQLVDNECSSDINDSHMLTERIQLMAEYQGDCIEDKKEKIFRLGLININGVTHTARNPKNHHIKETINKYSFDHMTIPEPNCNWTYMDAEDRWTERTHTWWKKSKSVVAHNIHSITTDIKQPGGVIGVTVGKTTSSVIDSGLDEPLGRWTWSTYGGKNNVLTTVISGYRPCRNDRDLNSTYNQQVQYFASKQITTCPRQIWLDDMAFLIKQFQEAQHQIILMADINENVKDTKIAQWAKKLGIREIVSRSTDKHVPTQQKGRDPIDGIFMSFSLTPVAMGYFPFGVFQSDHRALWVDLSYDSVFGFKLPDIEPSNRRRLQNDIPYVRESWKRHYKNFLHQHNLVSRQYQVEASIENGVMTTTQALKYEKILQQRAEGIAYADRM